MAAKVLDMIRYTNHAIDMLSGAGDLGTFPVLVFCVNSTDSIEFLFTRGINLTFGLGVPTLFPLLALPWILIRRRSNKLADTTFSLRTLRNDHIPRRRHIICIRTIRNCSSPSVYRHDLYSGILRAIFLEKSFSACAHTRHIGARLIKTGQVDFVRSKFNERVAIFICADSGEYLPK